MATKERQNISLQYPCTNLLKMLYPIVKQNSRRKGTDGPSAWFVAPYFLLYFTMLTMNTVIWPLQYMEMSCKYAVVQQQLKLLNITLNAKHPKKDDLFNPPASGLCLENSLNITEHHFSSPFLTSSDATLDLLILSAIGGGIVSLFSHFMVWTPLMYKCRALSLCIPPMVIMCQTTLFHCASAQLSAGAMDDVIYKYTMLLALLLPSLHCNFQGVFLLAHLITHQSTNQGAGIYHPEARLDGSYVVMTSCMSLGGLFMLLFNMDFDYIFFCQIVLGCVCVVYALALMPVECKCLTGESDGDDREDDDGVEGGSEDDTYIGHFTRKKRLDNFNTLPVNSPYASSEEELLEDLMRNRSSTPMVRELCKDVPHNFSETSYTKKWIIIIEICVFSIALTADSSMGSLFLVYNNFSINLLAYLVLLQGIVKIFGTFLIKGLTSFFKLRHGTLICLSALNYIVYYIALAFSSTKSTILAAVLCNFAGGITFPTLSSFIRSNLRGKVDQVLDKAVICSLVSTTCFHIVEYFVFSRTRLVFPGGVYLLCGFVMIVSIVLVCAIYITSTMTRKRRKSKYVCDMGSDQ